MSAYGFSGRETVGWQFHYKWCIFAFEESLAEKTAHEYCHYNAYDVERHHHRRTILLRKHSAYNHYIYREACRAAHERQYHHRYKARTAAFYCACRHYGRHIAAEAHDKRYERFAVQSHLVHQLVHDECCTSHVSAVFHERYEEIEYKNLRQEYDYRAYASDNAVDKHVLKRTACHVVGYY